MVDFSQVAEITLSYSAKVKAADRPRISMSSDIARFFRGVFPAEEIELREFFYVAFLSKANAVMGYLQLSAGGASGTVVDIKLLLGAALKAQAQAIILCHNHPSGNLKPSQADRDITRRILEAGKILDLSVLDHVILAPDGTYLSFADEGFLY